MRSLDAVELQPVTKQTLTESVTELLRDAILVRTLRPGQRIPEAKIATKFGVSRAPVREALAALVQEGLVHRDDRGVSVTELSRADVDEISTLRLALEKLAVELATRNATEHDFEEMQQNIEQTGRAKKPGEASELDLVFHELLVRAAKHKRLLNSWLSLKSQIRLFLYEMDRDDIEFAQHTVQAHQEFLNLLRARDGKRSLQKLELQLETTHQAVLEHLLEQTSASSRTEDDPSCG
ncbi:MAG TPA: GntR family transcriptional regulator [Isosphaeraceae bacterium]|nr:GntR family transcriptional regulator [Isosphaeraceae bacterium]